MNAETNTVLFVLAILVPIIIIALYVTKKAVEWLDKWDGG